MVRAQTTVELRPYDVEAWSVLLREAQNRHVNEVRSLYESLVAVFPTTARFWKIFIEQEVKRTDQLSINRLLFEHIFIFCFQMKARNFERVEKVNRYIKSRS